MARKSSGPWFWDERGQWVVNIRGKRYYLGTDRDDAYRQWHELSATPEATPGKVHIFREFLAWCKRYRPDSFEWYESRINEFAKTIPGMGVSELKPFHVQSWIDTKKSDGHKRGCLIAVNRALNWAVKQGLIDKNPIRHMEKPSPGRREVILTPDEFKTLLSHASDQEFKDLLNFIWETGCRPQEAFRLESRHLDGDRCVFPEKESKGKKRKRVVYLTPVAKEIVTRLTRKEGRIFRNADGNPWHRNNVACRFARMKTKLGRKLCLYNLRHSYCQRALKNGVDPVTLSELMGHASTTMIFRVYSHMQQDTKHMLEAAQKAAGVA
jgi:integrase